MKITRAIAATLIMVWISGSVQAQSVSDIGPPAEFPPASYNARQYIDSKGCIYIRAGVNGEVNWVPRVDRQRRHLCGYTPSLTPAQRVAAPARPAAPQVEIITEGQAAQPRAAEARPAPAVVRPEPAPTTRPVAVAPTPVAPRPAAPVRTATRPAHAPTVVATPQPTPRPKPVARVATAQPLPESTRVLPRHVYDNRRNTTNVAVPRGYRPVWDDDRLNPRRAERTLAPTVAQVPARVPKGYRPVWTDDRLNPARGRTTAAGDAATGAIWTDDLPRELREVPTDRQVIRVSSDARQGRSPYWVPPVAQAPRTVTRLSTRSEVSHSAGRAQLGRR